MSPKYIKIYNPSKTVYSSQKTSKIKHACISYFPTYTHGSKRAEFVAASNSETDVNYLNLNKISYIYKQASKLQYNAR